MKRGAAETPPLLEKTRAAAVHPQRPWLCKEGEGKEMDLMDKVDLIDGMDPITPTALQPYSP